MVVTGGRWNRVKAERLKSSAFMLSLLLFAGSALTVSATFVLEKSPFSISSTMYRTIDLNFILSSGEPSYTLNVDASTDDIEILSLQSNGTLVQLVASGVSGEFLTLSNVSSIKDMTIVLDWTQYGSSEIIRKPWNITFDRQTEDARVSVSLLESYTGIIVVWQALALVLSIGLGLVAIGVSIYWFRALNRSRKRDPRLAASRPGIAFVIALMLVSAVCFVPLAIGIAFGGCVGTDALWIGNDGSANIELNASHPQQQVEVRPYGNQPADVYFWNFSGDSVLANFSIGSTVNEFLANFTPGIGGYWRMLVRDDATLTFTRTDGNTTLNIVWLSGVMTRGICPIWSTLLVLLLNPATIAGLILFPYGLVVAKEIDTKRPSAAQRNPLFSSSEES